LSSFCIGSRLHFLFGVARFLRGLGLLSAWESVDVFEVFEFAGEQLNVEVHELVDELLLLREQRRSVLALRALLRRSSAAFLGLRYNRLQGDFLGGAELNWRWVGAAAEAEVEH